MGVLLGLLSAVAYGASDFAGGIGGRRSRPEAVAMLAQPIAFLSAVIAVLVVGGSPSSSALLWGALSGVGSGVGTVSLYRGLAVGRMSVVAPLSAVLSAAAPAIVGLSTGDRLSVVRAIGLVLALPAIVLVSRETGGPEGGRSAGIPEALVAGAGFAVFFIGLSMAGTDSGAWPLVPGQGVAVVCVVALGLALGVRRRTVAWSAAWRPAIVTGLLGGAAGLLYLAANSGGELSVVAVLASLYPAVTVLLARLLLHEHWQRTQKAGLVLAAFAVALVGAG